MKKATIDFKNTEIAFKHLSDQDLLRAWTLFRAINIKPLVIAGPPLVNLSLKLRLPVKGLLKMTVFRHFCGGETLDQCVGMMQRLRQGGVYSILDYGVEGEKSETGFNAATAEVLKVINATRDNQSVPFCVFKLTAIARFELLEAVSAGDPSQVSPQLAAEWEDVKSRVQHICDEAVGANKLVMIDAEESWIQPAVDQLAVAMMQKHNKASAKIYTTVQMYKTQGLDEVKSLLQRSRQEGWFAGIKLVRGAYMEKERARANRMGYKSPIHETKQDTDTAYNDALKILLAKDSNAYLCAGTHNSDSTLMVTDLMRRDHMMANTPRVWFAQLLGMSDDLTFNTAASGYNAAKYVPYGPVEAVLPYLFRRAQENTSIAGQSSRELSLIERELKRRKSL
jgi:proline dehydrogenase